MIKRTIEISHSPALLRIENDQLLLLRDDGEPASIPAEDVGLLIVDQPRTRYTHTALVRLAALGAVTVLCGPDHLPCAMVLPLADNELTARRLRLQASAPLPLRKRLWRQIVRRKVRLQAANLPPDDPIHTRLLNLADEVKSGDKTNIEGQAARLYWPALLGEDFRRDPDGLPPNALLNYGYAVMRASIARAIVAAGLHPVFALNHCNRNNTFALADDLVEVLRPRVDRCVVELAKTGTEAVDKEAKSALLNLLTEEVAIAGQKGPLMVQLHRVATSLLRCYEGEAKKLELP